MSNPLQFVQYFPSPSQICANILLIFIFFFLICPPGAWQGPLFYLLMGGYPPQPPYAGYSLAALGHSPERSSARTTRPRTSSYLRSTRPHSTRTRTRLFVPQSLVLVFFVLTSLVPRLVRPHHPSFQQFRSSIVSFGSILRQFKASGLNITHN